MGFYGNITNTSRTQFQFDLIYPSRYKMETQCSKDGVYIGRYVLIEYDSNPNNVIKTGYRKGKLIDYKDGSYLYAGSGLEEATRIRNSFFEANFELHKYYKDTQDALLQKGYVTSIMGRRYKVGFNKT